jgi:tyrosyl-tRNA synthetase
MAKSAFLAEAKARGFVFQCTDEDALDALCAAGPIAGYIGFDLTSDSLHVGSMVQIMLLRLMQRHGHKPVALMGGGTTRIGDPSFREEARQLLSDEQIARNGVGIRQCLAPFLTFGEGPSDAVLANNADWLDRLGYIDLLREVGVHVSVNRMLSFDSVRTRLEREQGLTFLEFNYSILQSYDFRELSRRYGVVLQMGGSDQWGNIVSGIDLVRRTDQKTVFGLTTPLITTASGTKMGKSAAGAVWLLPEKLGAYGYWQFWRNTEDADVGRFLRLFTDMPLDEIARLETLQGAELNEAKVLLASEATALVHGREAAIAAAATARAVFSGQTAEGLPEITLPQGYFGTGLRAFEVFHMVGLAGSNGEARRLIRGGGARIDDVVISEEAQIIVPKSQMKLSVGRKQHVLLRLV